jgi:ribonuclease HII
MGDINMTKTETISQIKEKIESHNFTKTEWETYLQDERKGVKAIVDRHNKRLQEKQVLLAHFQEMLKFEKQQWNIGQLHIAGIDEAGRGPLAGPVVAAAVVIDREFYIEGLNDSKKLSEKMRESFFDEIKEQAVSYGIGIVENGLIDRINIYQATKLAMKKAITSLSVHPEHLLIDAVQLTEVPIEQQAIIKGDQKSISIAAASVLAKVTRDRMMKEIDKEFPAYQFASNMGYGTKDHLEALQEFGPTPYHRMTFAPVKDYSLN